MNRIAVLAAVSCVVGGVCAGGAAAAPAAAAPHVLVVAPNGDSYIAWERNYISNLFLGDPYIYEHAAVVRPGATSR